MPDQSADAGDRITGTGEDGTTDPITIDAQAPGQTIGTPGTVRLDPDTLKMIPGSFVPEAIDEEDETLIVYPNEFPLREDLILAPGPPPPEFGPILDPLRRDAPQPEIELTEDPDVYGISFPKSMLPIGNHGWWEAEPLLDLDGEEDEALIRVWLHPSDERQEGT